MDKLTLPNSPPPDQYPDLAVKPPSRTPRVRKRLHAGTGVLAGMLSLTTGSPGSCDVWGTTAHLWLPIASSLGFHFDTIWFGVDTPIRVVEAMQAGWSATRWSQRGARRPPPTSPNSLVFTDLASLPSTDSVFWRESSALFVINHRDGPLCPDGWIVRGLTVPHLLVGGVTDGKWSVSIMGRSSRLRNLSSFTPALVQRPWSVISHSVDFRIHGPPCRAPSGDSDPTPSVITMGRRILGSWGLLTTANPFVRVVLSYPPSPTGWIRRSLTARELGDLWNVPLLLQDWFVQHGASDSLSSFLLGCPGKILHAGTSSLLDFYVSGGGCGDMDRQAGVGKRQRLDQSTSTAEDSKETTDRAFMLWR